MNDRILSGALRAAALSTLLWASAVPAHSDEHFDSQPSPNGGQIRMAGEFHFELVMVKNSKEVKENVIVVHVTDHAGKKISTANAQGSLTLAAGKLKATSTLTPDGDNRLKGHAKYASDPSMKVILQVTMPGKQTEQARFTPLAAVRQGQTTTGSGTGRAEEDHSRHR